MKILLAFYKEKIVPYCLFDPQDILLNYQGESMMFIDYFMLDKMKQKFISEVVWDPLEFSILEAEKNDK